MGIKKIFVLLLALTLIAELIGCGGVSTPMTAEQVRDAVIKARDNMKTVRMDADMQGNGTMDMRIEGTDYHITFFTIGNTTSETDMANEKSHVLSQTHSKFEYPPELQGLGNESPITDMTTESYLIDNVMYTKSYTADTTTTWTKQKFTGESQKTLNQMAQQVDMLKSAPVELLGSEQFDGIDCYVLEVTPDLAEMYQTMMQNFSSEGKWLSKIFDFKEMIKNSSMKMLVAKDNFFIIQDEMKMTLVMNQESIHMPLGDTNMEMKMDYEMVTRNYDYNKPVTITSPTEAPISG
jgi:hypothetical protein